MEEEDDLTHLSGAHRRSHEDDGEESAQGGGGGREGEATSGAPAAFGIGIQFKLHPSGLLCVNSIKEAGASDGKGILMGDIIAQVKPFPLLDSQFGTAVPHAASLGHETGHRDPRFRV